MAILQRPLLNYEQKNERRYGLLRLDPEAVWSCDFSDAVTCGRKLGRLDLPFHHTLFAKSRNYMYL